MSKRFIAGTKEDNERLRAYAESEFALRKKRLEQLQNEDVSYLGNIALGNIKNEDDDSALMHFLKKTQLGNRVDSNIVTALQYRQLIKQLDKNNVLNNLSVSKFDELVEEIRKTPEALSELTRLIANQKLTKDEEDALLEKIIEDVKDVVSLLNEASQKRGDESEAIDLAEFGLAYDSSDDETQVIDVGDDQEKTAPPPAIDQENMGILPAIDLIYENFRNVPSKDLIFARMLSNIIYNPTILRNLPERTKAFAKVLNPYKGVKLSDIVIPNIKGLRQKKITDPSK